MSTFIVFPESLARRSQMLCRATRFFPSALIAAAPLLGGCPPTPTNSCAGLSRGDRIELTVIEPFDSNSQYQWTPAEAVQNPCELGIDLANGQVLDATVVDFTGDTSCTAVPTYGAVGDWTWNLERNIDFAGSLWLHGVYQVTRGQCTGSAEVSVYADQTPFVAPVPGQRPHVILTRSLNLDATNPACPQVATAYVKGGLLSCSGSFVVSAKRL